MPARMSGDSIRSPNRREGPDTTARCGSQRMIRAPIPTSLSTKNSRFSYIFSKIITVPRAWVVLDHQLLVARHPQVRPLQLPAHAEPREAHLDRPQVVGDHVLDQQLAAGHHRQADEAADLGVVGTDGVLATAQPLDPADLQAVGADPGDPGAERVQEAAEVLHVGLAGGVADDRLAIGHGGRDDGVLGGRHRRLVEEHLAAAQPARLQLQRATLEIGGHAERPEGQQVRVEAPPADAVTARRGQHAAAGPRQQRAGQQHRAADQGAEHGIQRGPVDVAGVDAHGVGLDLGHLGAGGGDELEHGLDVADVGDVSQQDWLIGEQQSGNDRQSTILVAGRADHATQRLSTFDDETFHSTPRDRNGRTADHSTARWGTGRLSGGTRRLEQGNFLLEILPQIGSSQARMATFRLNPEMPPPAGDQPRAIEELVESIEGGELALSLLGVTGSGKTRTMAGVMERLGRPALVMAPNKTLAAQLTNEFKELFPDTAVEYFVSYYDYYQPEAYIPQSDTYIEKDSSMNEEIDRLRHSATSALLTRRDVIIVAS